MSDTSALPRRRHPSARRALALALVAVLGSPVVLPLLLAPLAWYLGLATRRDVERDPARWSGHGVATVATVLGIVGTALLAVVTLTLGSSALLELLRTGRDVGYGS